MLRAAPILIVSWLSVSALTGCHTSPACIESEIPADKEYVNTVGVKMVRMEPGSFMMGQPASRRGDWDEQPVHKVNITRPFYIAATEVTNAQYELFDPDHRRLRGRWGLSNADDEAVVFVSWNYAVAFCKWLSQKEGKPYRLIATSGDGGLTWSSAQYDSNLIGPRCLASTLRYSWPVAKPIFVGPTAYSCLAKLPNGDIGLLYERGDRHRYQKMTFARFTLDWLTNGKDKLPSN